MLQGGPPVVQLREIGLARYLDRREIVRSSDGNRLDVAYNDWWGEPLGAMLARVLVVGLSQRLPGSSIYNESGAIASDPNAMLAVNIQRLDVDQSGTLQLLAQAAVEFNRPRKSAARTFSIAKPVPAADHRGPRCRRQRCRRRAHRRARGTPAALIVVASPTAAPATEAEPPVTHPELRECFGCGMFQIVPALGPDQRADCARCGTALRRTPHRSVRPRDRAQRRHAGAVRGAVDRPC